MVPTHARERKDSFPKPHSTETPTMTAPELDDRIETKMRSAGVPTPTITAFLNALHKVASGERGMLRRSSFSSLFETVAALRAELAVLFRIRIRPL